MIRFHFVALLAAWSIGNLPSWAQGGKIPNGIYLTLEQLRKGNPDSDPNLLPVLRSSGDIAFNGGNDYRMESPGDSIGKKFLKKEIYAVVHNDSLFLNGAHLKLQKWYALALTHGNFVVFRACMTNSEAFNTALIGGAIAGAATAHQRFTYVLSQRTGNVRPLTQEYMEARLKDFNNPDLLAAYGNEPAPDADETMIGYLRKLNALLAVEAEPVK